MGFKDARARVTFAIRSGQFLHEFRTTQAADGGSPNWLRDGLIDDDAVIELLVRFCTGAMYESDRHDQLRCDVHIFKPERQGERWYIKTYFLSDLGPLEEGDVDVMFISVHPSVHRG